MRDTIAHGDESVDTAFVFSTDDVRVVGRLATIEADDGRHAYSRLPSARVLWWDVSGPGAELPGGAPLSSTWGDLRRIYGAVRVIPLNGKLYVSVCAYPRFRITMRDPTYATGSWPRPSELDSTLANVSIDAVRVPTGGAQDLSEAQLRRMSGCE